MLSPGKWLRSGALAGLPAMALAGLVAMALGGCARSVRLKALPAARGGQVSVKVELTYDRNDQLQIKLQAPDPSAYGPNYTRYVAWVATPDRAHVINVGQIRVEGGKGALQTLTPLRKFRMFLTVEEQGDVMKPGPLVVFEAEKDIDW